MFKRDELNLKFSLINENFLFSSLLLLADISPRIPTCTDCISLRPDPEAAGDWRQLWLAENVSF